MTEEERLEVVQLRSQLKQERDEMRTRDGEGAAKRARRRKEREDIAAGKKSSPYYLKRSGASLSLSLFCSSHLSETCTVALQVLTSTRRSGARGKAQGEVRGAQGRGRLAARQQVDREEAAKERGKGPPEGASRVGAIGVRSEREFALFCVHRGTQQREEREGGESGSPCHPQIGTLATAAATARARTRQLVIAFLLVLFDPWSVVPSVRTVVLLHGHGFPSRRPRCRRGSASVLVDVKSLSREQAAAVEVAPPLAL